MKVYLGRHVYGLAAIGFGMLALVWHDFNIWQQIRPLGNVPHREILLYIVAAIEIVGGIAILWPKTARVGAIALGTIYFIFALLWLPLFIQKPAYDRLGNFFEQFSLVSGALIVYASFDLGDSIRAGKIARLGYIFSESALFPSRSNNSSIFLERQLSFQSGFLRDKCSGRSQPRFCSRSQPSLYFQDIRPF